MYIRTVVTCWSRMTYLYQYLILDKIPATSAATICTICAVGAVCTVCALCTVCTICTVDSSSCKHYLRTRQCTHVLYMNVKFLGQILF